MKVIASTVAMAMVVLSVAVVAQTSSSAPQSPTAGAQQPPPATQPPMPAPKITLPAPQKAPAGEVVAASVDDISNSPERFYGKTVRVTEDVTRVLGTRLFTLDEETPLGKGKDVLVIAPAGVTVSEDQDVEVTGVVRRFVWSEIEKERFDFDFKPEWQVEFKERPIIMATSVRVMTR